MVLLVGDQDLEKKEESHDKRITNIFEGKIVNIFLPISFNICFGCSEESSH